MSFASKNRAAMSGQAPGAVGTRASGEGPWPADATSLPYYGPPVPPRYATSVPDGPATQTPYVAPVREPYVQPAPEVQWVTGVPNVVTGLTGLAAAYALYLAVAGEPRKNPGSQRLARSIFENREKNQNGLTWADWANAAGYPKKHPGHTAREFLALRKAAWRDGVDPHYFGARFE